MRTAITAKPESTRSFTPVRSPLLQRKCACGNLAGLTGECSECQSKPFTRQGDGGDRDDSTPLLHDLIQPKLTVGALGDKYEQEADRVADAVMRMPQSSVQPDAESEEEEMVQRKVGDRVAPLNSKLESSEVPPIVGEVLSSSGHPLDPETLTSMESRFGYDFSQVRIHTNVEANQSARSLNALAYTVGQNIVFGSNQYALETHQGKRLLAHELTHVVQQNQSPLQSQQLIQRQSSTTVVSCRNEQQRREVDGIISQNLRRYPSSVTMYLYSIQAGETLESIARRIQADNRVDLPGQLASELQQLNTHISPERIRIGDCVILLRGWAHPNIGSLPAAPNPAALPQHVKHAIATVYGEQWNTSTNAQEQQKYIWFSIRKRITSSVRGSDIVSVVTAGEYHAIGGALYNNAVRELDHPPLRSAGLISAQNAVLNNWSSTLPGNAGKFYFHWTQRSTPERCYGQSSAATPEEKERECAWQWANRQGWIGNVSREAGWLNRIRGNSNGRIGSMYIYP